MAQKYFGTNIAVGAGFDLGSPMPLDSRTVVANYSDLSTMPNGQLYKGLTVYVEADKTSYTLTDFSATSREWTPVGAGSGVTTVDTLAYATNTRNLTVAEEVGQLVYLTTDATITWTIPSEVEGSEPETGTETYTAGLYQVNAVGSLVKVATISDVAEESTARAAADTALSSRLTSVETSIAGLSSATHFIGVVESLPGTANNGDVVVLKVEDAEGNVTADKEYIYSKPSDAETGEWIELGDTSALASSVSALSTTVEGHTESITGLSATVSGHGTSIDTLNAFKTSASSSISTLESKVSALESVEHPDKAVVDKLVTDVQANTSDITGLSTSVGELETALTSYLVKDVDTTASSGIALTLTEGKVGVTVTTETLVEAIKPSLNITSADVKLSSVIGTEKTPTRYQVGDTVQSVLSSINERIESIDADIQSALEGGVTNVEAGNGISVDSTTPTKPKVSIKVAEGSALTAGTDGLDLVWGTF